MTDDLDGRRRREVGRLTAGPASGFVAARDARVEELKAAGEPELARVLAGQRRPTVPAWAVDQLAHHHEDELAALFAAAERVRDTQSAATPDRAAVREASAAFSAEVRRLRGLAEERLADAGTPPAAHLDEVEATLLAAVTDAQVAADVRAGALLRPAPSPGFAALASLSSPRRTPDGTGPTATGAEPLEPREPRSDEDDHDHRSAAEVELAARRAAELEAIADRRVELTTRRDELEDEADRAAGSASGARERAAQLRSEAEQLLRAAASADDEATSADEEEARARDRVTAIDEELAALDEQERQVVEPSH